MVTRPECGLYSAAIYPYSSTQRQLALDNGMELPEGHMAPLALPKYATSITLNFQFCDGEADCFEDESDEMNCENHTCAAGWRKCGDNKQCRPIPEFCDWYYHCHDRSDEDEKFCLNYT